MSIKKTIAFNFIFLLLVANIWSQQISKNLTVQLSALVTSSPTQITLSWINDGTGNGYKIFRRIANSGSSWGSAIANLSSSSFQYIDNNITISQNYEYKVKKNAGSNSAYGYINSSINLPAVINRGKLILVVENSFVGNIDFDNAVTKTINDIEADGWLVIRIDVNRNDAVTAVKQSIVNTYNLDNTNTKALYLLGHVPVPYSGLIYPDGHNSHYGAWPADVYYADIDGVWTDVTVNDISATRTENHNIPADGKFDQSRIPSDVELQMGRVDFFNLISFSDSEEELLIQYLNKTHNYKTALITATERALIDNNFTTQPEGFASSGYRNFSTMFNPQQTNDSIDYFTGTAQNTGASYMWSYGCGGGTYTSCGGIGNTTGFSTNYLQSIFTILFGSYFGDWDTEDNFMRASIAQGQTLTSVWSGRPHWQFHQMALGNNIGASAKLTQNNNGEYFSSTYTNFYKRKVHIALMGDLTLRMSYIDPPTNLTALNNNNNAELNWTPSNGIVLGYNIYRLLPGENSYTKINNSPITTTSYTDNSINYSTNTTYIVKAVNLKTTASGSYFNQSLGATTTTSIILGLQAYNNSKFQIAPNPSNNLFNLNWNDLLTGNVAIEVYGLTGKVILKENTNNSSYKLYLKQYPSGIYYVKIRGDDDLLVQKIVKY